MSIKQLLKSVMRDCSGATAIEYGLILAMVFLAILTAVNGFASENMKTWNNVSNKVNAAVNTSSTSG